VSLAQTPISVARLVELLEEECSRLASSNGSAAPIVATDADGTLWSGDVGEDLFEAVLHAGGLREEAREALAREAEQHDVAASGDANAIAAALYAAFQGSRYPQDRAFAMMAWAFAGYSTTEVDAFAGEVIARRGLTERFRPELRAALEFASARGIEVIVVSASPFAIVAAGVRLVGISADHVVAMRPRVEGSRLAPSLDGPVVYGEGKLTALRGLRPHAPILGAFGDSSYDAAMLRAARLPVAVHPSKGLLDVAPTIPGLVVIGGS
jgi:phosphoserine phosphatase